jgi:(1->4)-alpha-D-glucan 1-alpha-D-glucosylmutase
MTGQLQNASEDLQQVGTPEMSDGVQELVAQVVKTVTESKQTERLPSATYRVQFNAHCTFRDAQSAVSYLHKLGVSDLYASPFLLARPGSIHGYDIADHTKVNPEIGTLEELRSLSASLREHGMGMIADVVPNHMSNATRLNAWWQDVLENGPSSAYAAYFDIDWMPLKPDLANKVLLPVLSDQFGNVLEDGKMFVKYEGGAFWLEYFENCFPLAPGSYAVILTPILPNFQAHLGEEHPDVLELFSILTAIKNLPARTETDPDRLAERRREKEVVKRRLHELVERSPEFKELLSSSLRELNGITGDPRSFDRLDGLLEQQAYRLSYWRVAADEINYRRFFDINELAAICTENPQVFAETHRLLFDLIDDGTVTGLRIDHPDGLYDPRGYLCQLQRERFFSLCRRELTSKGISPDSDTRYEAIQQRLHEVWQTAETDTHSPWRRLLYVVVEKILAHNESIPNNWPIHGTVGYELLNAVNGLFVAPSGERSLSALYARFIDDEIDFDQMAYQCKRLIVRMSMASELSVLGHRLDRISERNRWTRDFTLNSLTRALQEVISCFGIYRTYVEADQVLERDVRFVSTAVARAKKSNPAMSGVVLDFIRDLLLLRYRENADEEERRAVQQFVGKFQQITGSIMAKAVEDTAFYRFNRLASLNEVGGDPAKFGTTLADFHALNQARLSRMAHTLNATSTHDTKRSEDVRARINVLSEVGPEWRGCVNRWSRWHRRLKTSSDGVDAPSRNDEYLLYQTIVGIWPGLASLVGGMPKLIDRIQQYMLKVVREAKVNSSWVSPNEAYEAALVRFISDMFQQDQRRPFLRDLDHFVGLVADHGRWNSLAQVVLKTASPGVPDIYQGMETWNLTLVDPDNRQVVDLAAKSASLDHLIADMTVALNLPAPSDLVTDWLSPGNETLPHDFLNQLLANRADGRIKQFITMLCLRMRRLLADLFSLGEYLPLEASGAHADKVIAFLRREKDRFALAIVPRFTVALVGLGGPPPLGDVWQDTTIKLHQDISTATWRNCFTRETLAVGGESGVRIADVLRTLPVALLVGA